MSAELLRRAALELRAFDDVMTPAVARALASWLDEQAAVVEGNDEHDGFDLDLIDGTARAATQVARAILREDSDGR